MTKELLPAMKLTVCVGGDERPARRPLYREALRILRECGVAGATLTKGMMSFGGRRRVHSDMNEVTMENLPIVIEAVDECKKVESAAQLIARMLGAHGLVQLQPTEIVRRAPLKAERSES